MEPPTPPQSSTSSDQPACERLVNIHHVAIHTVFFSTRVRQLLDFNRKILFALWSCFLITIAMAVYFSKHISGPVFLTFLFLYVFTIMFVFFEFIFILKCVRNVSLIGMIVTMLVVIIRCLISVIEWEMNYEVTPDPLELVALLGVSLAFIIQFHLLDDIITK